MKNVTIKRCLAIGVLLCLAAAIRTHADLTASGHASGEWVFPGEYESHQAMWMLWPTYENKAGFPSTESISDMIHAMSGHTHVNLAVQDADDEAAARSFMTARGVPLDHVHFFHIQHGDIWARDTGPQFTRNLPGTCASTTGTSATGGTKSPTANSACSTSRSTARPRPSSRSRCSTRGTGRVPACE